MDVVIWLLIISLFLLSFVGIVVPMIPGTVLLWGGFLLYHFFIDAEALNWFFWLAMLLITFILIGADLLMNYYFINVFGGSKWSQWLAVLGVLIGVFIYPPIGLIIVPFLLVFIAEFLQQQTFKQALKAAFGAIVGFLSSSVAKIMLQVIMIFWFFIVVFL